MSGIQLNTDFTNIEPNQAGSSQFPVTTDKMGWLVHIIDSKPVENKAKTGMLAVFVLEGLDGVVKGVTMDHRCNLANPNQQSVTIGFGEMSAIAHCIGVLRVGNTMEMHRKPFRVLVRAQKDNDKYNEVYGILDVNGNEPGKAGQGPANGAGGFGGQQGGQQGGGFGGGNTTQGGGFTPNQGGDANQGGGAAVDPNAGQTQQGGQQWQPNTGAGAGPGNGQPAWTK